VEFQKHAGREFVAIPCECCDIEICEHEPIFFEHDERGLDVYHAWCWEFGKEQREIGWMEGRRDAFCEASLLLQHNTTADALTALQVRAATRHSGCDLDAAFELNTALFRTSKQ
jgi:hypothetical protein